MRKYGSAAAITCTLFLLYTILTGGIEKTRGGGKDLVEELYEQAVKQNNNLQSIEEGVAKFYKKKEEALEKYNSFTSYHQRYYAEARAHTNTIADVAIRQRATDLLQKSESSYQSKIADWQNTIKGLQDAERELKGLHVLLKLMMATSAMEKNQQLPDKTKLNETAADLQSLLERIKAITK